jgi:hypothetical protein
VSHLFPISFFPYINPLLFFSLATGARRQHRGPRTDGKKSLNRQSYQRRKKLFHDTVPDNETVPHALPTEASRDHRTKEEIDAVLPWVSQLWTFVVLSSNYLQAARIVAKYPFRPPNAASIASSESVSCQNRINVHMPFFLLIC